MMKRLAAVLLLLAAFFAAAAETKTVLYLAGASQVRSARRVFRSLTLPPSIRFRLVSDGSDPEALNAAIAGSILLWEMRR